MPQNNLFSPGLATSSKLNLTAPVVIKASKGRIARININAPGATAGSWTINDCATLAAASAANTVWMLAFGEPTNVEGASFQLDFPCQNGIVLSALPTGGNASISFR